MQTRMLIIAGIVVAIVIGIGVVLTYDQYLPKPSEKNTEHIRGFNFTYSEMNSFLKNDLHSNSILMSSPVKIKDKELLEKYCKFFDDEKIQKLIQYCTSTELKDKNEKFLGNIHIVGAPDSPELVLVIIQTDPFMNQLNDIKTTFDVVIKSVICDCWEQFSPDGFHSVSEWVEGMKDFHTSGTKPHSKSKILSLNDSNLQIELTTNENGYLWKLLISK